MPQSKHNGLYRPRTLRLRSRRASGDSHTILDSTCRPKMRTIANLSLLLAAPALLSASQADRDTAPSSSSSGGRADGRLRGLRKRKKKASAELVLSFGGDGGGDGGYSNPFKNSFPGGGSSPCDTIRCGCERPDCSCTDAGVCECAGESVCGESSKPCEPKRAIEVAFS